MENNKGNSPSTTDVATAETSAVETEVVHEHTQTESQSSPETHSNTPEPTAEAPLAEESASSDDTDSVTKTDTATQNEPVAAKPVDTVASEINTPASNKTHAAVKLSLFVTIIIALLAMGLSTWLYLSFEKQQASQQQVEANLAQYAQQMNQSQGKLSQQLSTSEQRLQSLESQQKNDSAAYGKLQALEAQTESLHERVSVVARRSPNHWMASEAEYLVRMAGRKLWLEKDPLTAASLLEAADERIKSMRDPALMPLRQALARDIKATKAIKTTDVVGTVYTLDALVANLDQLPLNRAKSQAGEDLEDNGITDSISDWQSNLAKTWQEMTDTFITIRKRTTDLEPLLAPEQQWYLIENIRNKLLQAQMALYNYDEINYRQSIAFATTWIKQYFDLEQAPTQDAINTLDALSTLKIEQINHHNFQSTRMLQQLITYGELMPVEESAQ